MDGYAGMQGSNGFSDTPDCRFAVMQAFNPESLSLAMTGWDHCYTQVDRSPFHATVTELLLGPLQLTSEQIDNPFGYHGRIRRGYVTFALNIQEYGDLVCAGSALECGTLFCFPRDHSHCAFGNGPVKYLSLSIEAGALGRLVARRLGGEPPAGLMKSVLTVVEPNTVRRFHRQLTDILEEAAENPERRESSEWRIHATERLLDVVFEVVMTSLADPRRPPPPSTRSYVVEKAVEFMKANLASPPGMAAVCRAVRVCPRTLRYSFEELVGVSPSRFLLALRLQGVRRELMEAGPGSSIQTVAPRYGFWHLSRFAQFYREAFGELPSETCRRIEAEPQRRRNQRFAI